MKQLDHSSLGYPKSHPDITTPVRKPLSVSPSDDVSLLIETVTGKLVNPTNPDADTICIDDIAWALSRIPRYVGHTVTEMPYNVAQHSVYVAKIVELIAEGKLQPDFALDEDSIVYSEGNCLGFYALFHDAHEAYTGDIPHQLSESQSFVRR